MTEQQRTKKFSPRSDERACGWSGARGRVRLAVGGDRLDAGKIGCTAETLRSLGAPKPSATRASGPVPPRTSASGSSELEREKRELRQANEILRKASAYFAQAELDRRLKP